MEWNVAVGVVCTIVGAALSYLAFSRTKSKDDAESGKRNGTILTEVGYIKSGIDDIKRKQDRQDEQYLKISERVASVEASAKQAHHRIDRLEGRGEI